MTLKWVIDQNVLSIGNNTYHVTNLVRNELNGWRKLHDPKEVRRSVVNGQWGPPYMPRRFPKGTWKITGVIDTNDPEFAPIKITTDAKQEVNVWALDENGGYDHKTDEKVMDSGYHLHWSEHSQSTLGCGRVGYDTDDEVRSLAQIIHGALTLGEEVFLEVV